MFGGFENISFLCTRKSKLSVPWMSGLVSGLQNRVRRFESARNLETKLVPWMSGLVSGLQNRVRRFESARYLSSIESLDIISKDFLFLSSLHLFSQICFAFPCFIYSERRSKFIKVTVIGLTSGLIPHQLRCCGLPNNLTPSKLGGMLMLFSQKTQLNQRFV